jgi:hypothetical protein
LLHDFSQELAADILNTGLKHVRGFPNRHCVALQTQQLTAHRAERTVRGCTRENLVFQKTSATSSSVRIDSKIGQHVSIARRELLVDEMPTNNNTEAEHQRRALETAQLRGTPVNASIGHATAQLGPQGPTLIAIDIVQHIPPTSARRPHEGNKGHVPVLA